MNAELPIIASTETPEQKPQEKKVLVTFTTTDQFEQRIRDAMQQEGFTRRSAFVYNAVREYVMLIENAH